MTDLPILFSAPMVQAMLRERKTQTRRILKPQPGNDGIFATLSDAKRALRWVPGDRLWVREAMALGSDPVCYTANGAPVETDGGAQDLWMDRYKRDHCPGIHMPRWASRLTLIVTGVKVERLLDISAVDAEAEGVEWESADPPFYYVPGIFPHSRTAVGVEEPGALPHAVRSYAKLWGEINGHASWVANPWVVVLTFRVIKANIDSPEAAQ
jgi:hypothetical protein